MLEAVNFVLIWILAVLIFFGYFKMKGIYKELCYRIDVNADRIKTRH